MKIRIIGGSGSGKSYLGAKLAKHTNTKLSSIDEIVYDFSNTRKFEKTKSDKKIAIELKSLFNKKNWIIEGSWYALTRKSYDDANILIFLKPTFCKRLSNTLKRFFKRIQQGNYEGIINFLILTTNNIKTRNKWSKRHSVFKKKYSNKLYVFQSADKAYEWFVKKYTQND